MTGTIKRCELSLAVERLWVERYPSAKVLFCGGSVVRGEGLATSDLDVVVLFEHVPNAWRESFHFCDWPVEVFAHDPETLAYFVELDEKGGRPSLAQMISEALTVPTDSPWASAVQSWARAKLADTPAALSANELEQERYAITDLLNDFRDERPREGLVAVACQLYPQISNFVLKSRGRWLGSGKTLPRLLRLAAPELSSALEEGFETFFRTGEHTQAIAAVESALEPFGGEVFDGFRADAPADFRVVPANIPLANAAHPPLDEEQTATP